MHYEQEPLAKSKIGLVRGVKATGAHEYAPAGRGPTRAEETPEILRIVRKTIEEKKSATLEDLRLALAQHELFPSKPLMRKILENEKDITSELIHATNHKYLEYTLIESNDARSA